MNPRNAIYRNHAKNTDDYLYGIEKRLGYLECRSGRNNLRIEGVAEEEEVDDENWNQSKEKVSSISKSKLKVNNVKIEQSLRLPRRKRSIARTNLVT